ncbi:hypothetical protein NPIL_606651 [Nephila pilipes]|uniref:Secreted protein n=1 Tax=Nephila pilipes TaxID=299642 RepID=A0A8X6NJB9_NEPPI|nr:hypothetical protein NPIL_606651 [Nephila pilipes]
MIRLVTWTLVIVINVSANGAETGVRHNRHAEPSTDGFTIRIVCGGTPCGFHDNEWGLARASFSRAAASSKFSRMGSQCRDRDFDQGGCRRGEHR